MNFLMCTKPKKQRNLAHYKQTHKRQRNLQLDSLDYEQKQEAELSPLQKFCVENLFPVADKFSLLFDNDRLLTQDYVFFLVSCMIWIL